MSAEDDALAALEGKVDGLIDVLHAVMAEAVKDAKDRRRLEFVMRHLFIQDAIWGGMGCRRIYDTRGAIDEAMAKWKGSGEL